MIRNDNGDKEKILSIFKEWAEIVLKQDSGLFAEQTVGRFNGMKFSINANDHNPPHIHVMRKDQPIARMNLIDNTVMSDCKDFTNSNKKDTVKWLNKNNQNGELTSIFSQYNESVDLYPYFKDGEWHVEDNFFTYIVESSGE